MHEEITIEKAIERTGDIEANTEFIVRDLFIGYVWDREPLQNRFQLGKKFQLDCDGKRIPNIEKTQDLTDDGQQIYRRI